MPLVFYCDLAAMLWDRLHQLFLPFFSARSSWINIVFAQQRRLRPAWRRQAGVVHDVWYIICAVSLHFIWCDLNLCLFHGRRSTPVTSALMVIFTTSSAHFRYSLRHWYDAGQQKNLTVLWKRCRATVPSTGSCSCIRMRLPSALLGVTPSCGEHLSYSCPTRFTCGLAFCALHSFEAFIDLLDSIRS